MNLFDGNAIAADQYQAGLDRTEKIYATHETEVIEELVDDIMCGRKVGHWRLADLLVNEDFSELEARLVMADRDTQVTIIDQIRARCEAKVREWVETDTGQAIVADRIYEGEQA